MKNLNNLIFWLLCALLCSASSALAQSDQTDIEINTSSTFHKTEIDIAVDKSNKNNLIIGWNSMDPMFFTWNNIFDQGRALSNDGGGTYFDNSNTFPNTTSADVSGDPTVGFNATRDPYMFTMRSDGGLMFTMFQSSNWNAIITLPPIAIGDKLDKIMSVAVDDDLMSQGHNNVYVAGTNFPARDLVFSRLVSGTSTFTTPINIVSNRFSHGADVQMGPDSKVYVAWTDYGASGNLPGSSIGIARSDDHGVSFTLNNSTAFGICGIRISNEELRAYCKTRVNDFPSMAVDRSCLGNRGRVYVCWSNQVNCNASPINKGSVIQMRFSDDEGATWSNVINVSKPGHSHAWFPRIAVDDRTGLVTVAYFTFDDDRDCDKTNTFLSHSSNGGSTWSHLKVSDQDHKPNDLRGAASGYAGDYIGIGTHDNTSFVAWHDNRNGKYSAFLSKVDFSLPTKINFAHGFEFTSNTTLSGNFELFAKGKISMSPGIILDVAPGSNIHMRSETEIDMSPKFLANHPDVLLEVGPVDCYDIGSTSAPALPPRHITVVDPVLEDEFIHIEPDTVIESTERVAFNVYPNPSRGRVTIEASKDDHHYGFEVRDLTGKVRLIGACNEGGKVDINLDYLPSGIYIVVIDHEITKKIIISH